MKDFWARMNPAVAALLRAIGIGIGGAVLAFLYSFFQTYETPAEAGTTFAVCIMLARVVVEGAYDWWRANTGRSVDYPGGTGGV